MRCLLLLFAAASTVNSFQLPFKVPSFFRSTLPITDIVADVLEDPNAPPRIAIIGAGAGGSSAAFFINKAKERFGLNVEIDVYERSSYIGGRSIAIYPYDNDTYRPVELGGSIFVQANKHMWRASEEFNLTRRDFDKEIPEARVGIWDGEKIMVTIGDSWIDKAKLIWRYGFLSPTRTKQYVQSMIKSILVLYTAETPRWDNVNDLAAQLGWSDHLTETISDYLQAKGRGVTRQFVHEMVEAATRVNYGQNADEIHALGGMVSLATDEATGIEGGNYQIFEQFLKESNATIFLNTPVTSIVPKSAHSNHWTVRTEAGSTNYKAVILAAPFHGSGITVPLTISDAIDTHPYVKLHVTLLTTTLPSLPPQSLGLPEDQPVLNMILTTYESARNGAIEPQFNSLSWHGKVSEDEHVVKIFSKEVISDEWLDKMFNGTVGWVHRKVWDAYPRLITNPKIPPVRLDEGFMYLNSMEPLLSTMETSVISARNAVDLLLNEVFHSSICGKRLSDGSSAKEAADPKFVFGWDC